MMDRLGIYISIKVNIQDGKAINKGIMEIKNASIKCISLYSFSLVMRRFKVSFKRSSLTAQAPFLVFPHQW